jgi:hypothetical protein
MLAYLTPFSSFVHVKIKKNERGLATTTSLHAVKQAGQPDLGLREGWRLGRNPRQGLAVHSDASAGIKRDTGKLRPLGRSNIPSNSTTAQSQHLEPRGNVAPGIDISRLIHTSLPIKSLLAFPDRVFSLQGRAPLRRGQSFGKNVYHLWKPLLAMRTRFF